VGGAGSARTASSGWTSCAACAVRATPGCRSPGAWHLWEGHDARVEEQIAALCGQRARIRERIAAQSHRRTARTAPAG
jgi:hypothetical protein